LSRLQNLRYLILAKNPITDFKQLNDFKKLTELSLDKTQMVNAEIQALQEALPNCKIEPWSWSVLD
jgi:Leucine-rich repeat (LRR) protein